MVMLRSGAGGCRMSLRTALNSSSEFLSLDLPSSPARRVRTRAGAAAARAQSSEFSADKVERCTGHRLRSMRKNNLSSSDSSFDNSMEVLSENVNGRHFTRQSAKLQADKKNEDCKEVTRSLKTRAEVKAAEQVHEESRDVEVRRSCRIRRSRYSTTNQSVLFDKLITNTAEAVLQKMDDMKKMRRRRMMDLEDLGVFNDAEEENLDMYSRGKQKMEIQRTDEETTDNQDGSAESSEEGEDQEDDDGEDNQKRYDLRQRKTVVRYQAPMEKPRHQRKPKLFYPSSPSPVRRRYSFSSAGPRSPYCKRITRRKHAIHNSDSTSSSSSSSDDEERFERRKKRSRNRTLRRCLPLNFRKDELKGVHKDRMKIGASLADVDPMQIDCSVRFSSVGGLSTHISALKEMVVFPLLYPEVFERFKIQPPSSIVSTLLALMDGLDSRGEIVVIGATNRLDSIDPALRRPGRFDREFLFTLPDKEARKEILKIHTRDWNPKLLDTFLEELAEKCVGYCGADIKSICAEAALCALRRRYPQIYTSSEKLQLDISSIKITAKDFVVAMQKTVPASQRAVTSPSQALSSVSKPLLETTLHKILEALNRVFPHAELGLSKGQKSDVANHILENGLMYSDEESPSMFEDDLFQKTPKRKENFLNFNRSAYHQPTSYRPRLLIAGEPGYGQSSHLAPAVIHALEKFAVYTLELSVLFGISTTSPEETCAQLIREAKRTAPSIIYIPHVHLWWETVGFTLRATFTTILQNIPSFAPVLLLATSDMCYAALPQEVQELFVDDYGEVFNVTLPNSEERRKFFEDLILHQAAKPPVSKKKAVLQALEVLPVAPPPEPRQLTEEEVKRLEEQEEDTLRELRIFLRNVTHRLAIDKRFRAFTKPVDPEEVPDYIQVIKQPMDLSTVICKIDLHQYLTARDYLKDIDLICSNALEYNPDKDPGDRLIRHRACTLRDTAYAIVREEMDEDFEQLCEEIQESRKKRGCSSSKYAPSYYYVMPKENSISECKNLDLECHEKVKVPAMPMDSSTPFSNALSKRKPRRRNRWSLGSITKKRRISQFNKENKIPEEEEEEIPSDGEEFLENSASSMDQTEVVAIHGSLMEEGEIALQERQTNCCENKSEIENRGEKTSCDKAKHVSEKEASNTSVCLEPRKESEGCNGEIPHSQIIENSGERDSNDGCILRMTRARRSQVEQQQLISVEKAMEILSEPASPFIVDYEDLKKLLTIVTEKSRGYHIFHLEKLYAILSQCIYQHRKDHDKTKLIQEMKKEIALFS
ncbi:ATPase family AAA domain-containing protein 2 isoform X2 [Alligator sinensis]|uniref:ATPase family AAA domain-containing protein 2 isoform X2 n=1 Tax=Alligator sinensis TaxID=38654 RepID=A0A3Q0H1U1_ALLSI|nr:ATPase family AAA domain-containing protein 2 isoform X2 [Alligator sinensis]